MNTPHKHKDLIIAWANGAKMQFFCKVTHCWMNCATPGWHYDTEYRVKPTTIKYRRYIYKDANSSGEPRVYIYNHTSTSSIKEIEAMKGFRGWIDHEWQEVEV